VYDQFVSGALRLNYEPFGAIRSEPNDFANHSIA
jgi:hypothetical protein